MGAAQEKCEPCEIWALMGELIVLGFYDTLSQSKKRGAVWRVVGWALKILPLSWCSLFFLQAADRLHSAEREWRV